jgi:hypothetical protein
MFEVYVKAIMNYIYAIYLFTVFFYCQERAGQLLD